MARRNKTWTSIGGKVFNAVQVSGPIYKVSRSPSLRTFSTSDTQEDTV